MTTTQLSEEEVQRETYILELRRGLETGISGTLAELQCAREMRAELASNSLYDVEHADRPASALAERFLAQADDALRAAAAIVADIHGSAA